MDILTDGNFSVVILCPDCNLGGLRYTVNSLKADFPEVSYVVMVGKNSHPDNVKEVEKLCRVYKGGKTITSLIDVGLGLIQKEWGVIMTSGSRFRYTVFKKYAYFTRSNKDILYSVVDHKYLFNEASINGVMMAKKSFQDIGEFGDGNDNIQEAKLHWAGRAIEKGYNFKALVGARLV
jgi:hypothetical protein